MRARRRLQGAEVGERNSVGDFHGSPILSDGSAGRNTCLQFAQGKSKRASGGTDVVASSFYSNSRIAGDRGSGAIIRARFDEHGQDPWRFAGDSTKIAMFGRTPARCAFFLVLSTLFSAPLFAQYVCEFGNGPLDSAPPAGITTNEIIERFATKESTFKAARQHYGYALDVTVQTLNGSAIDGTYHQVSEISVNERGEPIEKTTFAPQNTLYSLGLTKADLDDIRERLPFVLTADHLSQFSITYVGRQHVDELDAYVFDISPKNDKNDKRNQGALVPPGFKGRVWVDDHDFVIVKTCGKARPDENASSRSRNAPANLTPTFVTYREQVDGKYWFTTYARADEFLHFPTGGVHVRELVKYSNYKALSAK